MERVLKVFTYVYFILLYSLVIQSCGSKKADQTLCKKHDPKYLNLEIILSTNLGSSSNNSIPNEIEELIQPLVTECGILIFKGSMRKIGFTDKKYQITKELEETFAGDNKNINYIKRNITRQLKGIKLPDYFYQPNLFSYDTLTKMYSDEMIKNEKIIVYSGNKTNIDSLKIQIKTDFYLNGINSFALLFKPIIVKKDSIPEVKSDIITNVIDINELIKLNDLNLIPPISKFKVAELIRINNLFNDYLISYPHSIEVLYAKAKNRCNVKDFTNSIESLKLAAKLSIDDENAISLNNSLDYDKQFSLKSLAANRKAQFEAILDGLQYNDKSLIDVIKRQLIPVEINKLEYLLNLDIKDYFPRNDYRITTNGKDNTGTINLDFFYTYQGDVNNSVKNKVLSLGEGFDQPILDGKKIIRIINESVVDKNYIILKISRLDNPNFPKDSIKAVN